MSERKIKMNNKFRRTAAVFAAILAATMVASGCADNKNESSEEIILKLPLEFNYNQNSDSDELNAADPTGSGAQNGGYVVVTEPNGQPVTEYINVTDANGEPVTQIVEVTNASGEVEKDASGQPVTKVVEVTEAAEKTEAGGSSYSAKIDSANIQWVDISTGKDFVFNDNFFTVYFKVKDTAADGVYDIKITEPSFSSIVNGGTVVVADKIMDGKVFISTDAEEQPSVPDSGFTMYTDYIACKQGDEIQLSFNMKNNPGIVGMNFWFEYDKNALEIVRGRASGDYAEIANADFHENPQNTEAKK